MLPLRDDFRPSTQGFDGNILLDSLATEELDELCLTRSCTVHITRLIRSERAGEAIN